jgi:ubiquinone/menaquinone biosynthesis C-methylase UbiE
MTTMLKPATARFRLRMVLCASTGKTQPGRILSRPFNEGSDFAYVVYAPGMPSWNGGLAPARNAFIAAVRPLDYRRVDECRRVIEWAAPRTGDQVLDVGCGDGHYDRRLAAAGCTVHAIDARSERVALAVARNPHPRVSYYHMPAEQLAFPDGRFDVAVSICVLEHITDDLAALREIHRVLRPGGRLVLSCDSLSNRGVDEELRERHAVRYAVQRFYTRESLTARLESLGFAVLRTSYVLTSSLSLAIARFTYMLDDVGRLPGGWAIKFPGLALAGTVGLAASRAAERISGREGEGLTLLAEARKPS